MLAPFVKFLAVGVLNSAVGLSVIFLGKWAAGMPDVQANLLGYAVGLTVSFVMNRGWTFRHTGASGPAALRFAAVIAAAYLLNLSTVLYAIGGLRVDSYLAQALGVVPYTLFTFFGLRYYAFRAA